MAHVVGGLTLDEGRLFRSHLLECTACRARVGELRAIAHDLADVERDERRERAAKRTETKERQDDQTEVVPATTRRFRARGALLIGVGLVMLMALSSWNFVLRSRVDAATALAARQREAIDVLQNGTRWKVLTPTEDEIASRTSNVEGQVSALDGDLVLMVDGLADDSYGIYLQDAASKTIYSEPVEATDGSVLALLENTPPLEEVRQLLLVRTDDVMPTPHGAGPTVFAAESVPSDSVPEPEANDDVPIRPAGETGG